MATNVFAPMEGKIIKVKVKPGDRVRQNQPLLVIEAMKMEMDIVSPVTGTIKEVNILPEQIVTAQQLLVTIEPLEAV